MSSPFVLQFKSTLRSSRGEVWAWITSVEGITRETMPFFRMTTPAGIRSLTDVKFVSGKKLFRSVIYFGGLLPLDYSDLTLIELKQDEGFKECSPMFSMHRWQHERWIRNADQDGCVDLIDTLTFEPRFLRAFTGWLVNRIFVHRHAVLRAELKAA